MFVLRDIKLKKENVSKSEDFSIHPSQPLSQNVMSLRISTF